MKHKYQTKLFAGRTVNYKGEKVIAIHVPGRKYRILATEPQLTHLQRFFRSKVVILPRKDYNLLRRS